MKFLSTFSVELVNPARAGMILRAVIDTCPIHSKPRASGDDPGFDHNADRLLT